MRDFPNHVFLAKGNERPWTGTVSKQHVIIAIIALFLAFLLLAESTPQTMNTTKGQGQGSMTRTTISYDGTDLLTLHNPGLTSTTSEKLEHQSPEFNGSQGQDRLSSVLERETHELGSLVYYTTSSDSTIPSTHNVTETLEHHLPVLNASQRQNSPSSILETEENSSGSMLHYTTSYDSSNSSTPNGTRISDIVLEKSEYKSPVVNGSQRHDSPSSVLEPEIHGLGSMAHFTISCNSTKSSPPNDTGLSDIISEEPVQQSPVFNASWRQDSLSPGLKTESDGSGSKTRYSIRYKGMNPSTLIGSDQTGIALVIPEQQPSKFKTAQRQENMTSVFDTARHGSGHLISYGIRYTERNPAMFTYLSLANIGLVKPEQRASGSAILQRQENQSSELGSIHLRGISYKDIDQSWHNGSDLRGIVLPKRERQFPEFDSPQKLVTRMLNKGQGRLGSASQYPTSTLAQNVGNYMRQESEKRGSFDYGGGSRGRQPEAHKQSGGDLASCFSPLNLKKSMEKLRQLTSKESIRGVISTSKTFTKTMSKKFSDGVNMSTLRLRAALDKVRECKCVQNTLSTGQVMQGKIDQEHLRRDNQYEPYNLYGEANDRYGAGNQFGAGNKYGAGDQYGTDEQYRPKPSVPQGTFNFGTNLGGIFNQERPRTDTQYGPTPDVPHSKPKKKRSRVEPKPEQWTDFELECLQAHNGYRATHGVPNLKLNRALCKSAQTYVNRLAATDPVYALDHSDEARRGEYAENLSGTRGFDVTGRSAVDDWYNEINNYNFNTAWAIDETKEFSHFTQLIWRDTKDMGVGYATSRSGITYVVCHYQPEGNIMLNNGGNRLYYENVPPPIY